MKKLFIIAFISILIIGCKDVKKTEIKTVNELSKSAKKVRDYMMKDMVIAHRGTTYWAPEETEAAFRWARNIGADYLELDLQMTKDSVLIALHDDDLRRTTNITSVFPERDSLPAINFTLKELRSLDAGSWFNEARPNQTRKSFENLKIMTLKDVIMIAEGYHIKKEKGISVKETKDEIWTGQYLYEKDPNDKGNRPGIYAETKTEHFEKILAEELKELGWLITTDSKEIKTLPNKVGVANTDARFILQSFYPESIVELEKYLPNIPKCLLLWKPDMKGEIKVRLQEVVSFAVKNNVHIIGSSIAGKPNNYGELTAPWMTEKIHETGMIIHPYTFDTLEQLNEYNDRVDGVFTNRADLALEFYGRKSNASSEEVLTDLGY
jgi:glycerophosphoryl diester phosphodiesterase